MNWKVSFRQCVLKSIVLLVVKRNDNSDNIECLWGSCNCEINTTLDLAFTKNPKGKSQGKRFLNDRYNRERCKKLLSGDENECYFDAQGYIWKKEKQKCNTVYMHASSRKVFWQWEDLSAVLAKSGPLDFPLEKSFLPFFAHEKGLRHMFQKKFSCSPIPLFLRHHKPKMIAATATMRARLLQSLRAGQNLWNLHFRSLSSTGVVWPKIIFRLDWKDS